MSLKLPPALVQSRSALAQALGLLARLCRPASRRLAMFVYEAWARGQIRGRIAPGVQFFGMVTVEGSGDIVIGPGTRLGRRVYLETREGGQIRIGANCVINDGATLVAYSSITLEDFVMMGEYATIRDANHGTRRGECIRLQPHTAGAVTIGTDAWIGRGACVLKGVTVGAGAVVGANSVVTRDVEANVIVAGAPARPIGERSE
jgi:acetyltransferase-like isoleucine patch superfamily enzyme